MKLVRILLLGILGMRVVASVFAEGGEQVFVVFNTRIAESKGVAEHYATVRHVPADQILGLDMPTMEEISRQDFRERLQKPLVKALENRRLIRFGDVMIPAFNGKPKHTERGIVESKIRYLLLCYGVPLKVSPNGELHEPDAEKLPPELRKNGAAVDNELACLPVLDHMMLAGPRENIFYGATNAQAFSPTNGIFMVARLDGPTAEIARSLVDKAIVAETNGLWGRGYFDLRGLTNGPYKMGDDWIHVAAEVCREVGFDTIVDTNGGTFPPMSPMSQAAFYAGWYSEHADGPFARGTVEFMPGAFAYHLHSFSAASLRTTKRQWVGPLLACGATATMGCVDEPFLGGTPNIGVFFARFVNGGFSLGEAAYASQAFLSWQTTVVGDPLYRPFGRSPLALIEDLQQRKNPDMAWAFVRLANLRLMQGGTLASVIEALEQLPIASQSAVLQEKIADLYERKDATASSIRALQEVLKLNPTPEQRVRVMLELGERLATLGRDQEAYDDYQQFLKQYPQYPDPVAVYRSLLGLAEKLGRSSEAAGWQHQITLLTEPRLPSSKGPPQRHGT